MGNRSITIEQSKLKDEEYRRRVFEALLRDNQNAVYCYCVERLGSVHGEDIAQDVFVAAWENLKKYRGDASIKTWLIGIAKNKCNQFFRNHHRRKGLMNLWLEDIRNNVHGNGLLSADTIASLIACMQQLPDQDGVLVKLRYLKGLPIAEISDLFGRREATIRKQLHRILEKLKKCFE